jgi:hypothetical protein
MEKGRFLVILTTAACSVLVVACGGSDDSTFTDPAQPPPGEAAPISPIVPAETAPPSPTPVGAPKCEAAIPATFKATWLAPARQKVCSPADLKGYYDACLADPSKKEQCSAWTKDHGTCTSCIEPADKSGPVQWHDSSTTKRLFYTLNVAGCIAVQQDKVAESDCGATYNAAVQCGRSSCSECLETGGSFPQFRTCQQAVQQEGLCKSYEAAMQAACQGITTAGQPSAQCFPGSAEAQVDHFVRVEGVFCGQ